MSAPALDITWRPEPAVLAARPQRVPWRRLVPVSVRLVLAVGVGVWLLLVAGLVAMIPVGQTRSRVAHWGVRQFCRLLLAALGLRLDTEGTEAIPSGSLVVANHRSWLDVLVMLATVPCTFVGKREIQAWPLIGPLAEALGIIWIDRHRARDLLRVVPAMREALAHGRSVVLFPEATTTDGHRLLPFRSGLFQAVMGTSGVVVPCALSGTAEAGDLDALCWYGDEDLLRNVPRVMALRGAAVRVRALPPLAISGTRKTMARDAHAALATLVVRVP